MELKRLHALTAACAFAPFLALPGVVAAATVTNPICPTEFALFNPDSGSDIVVPPGFKGLRLVQKVMMRFNNLQNRYD